MEALRANPQVQALTNHQLHSIDHFLAAQLFDDTTNTPGTRLFLVGEPQSEKEQDQGVASLSNSMLCFSKPAHKHATSLSQWLLEEHKVKHKMIAAGVLQESDCPAYRHYMDKVIGLAECMSGHWWHSLMLSIVVLKP